MEIKILKYRFDLGEIVRFGVVGVIACINKII